MKMMMKMMMIAIMVLGRLLDNRIFQVNHCSDDGDEDDHSNSDYDVGLKTD